MAFPNEILECVVKLLDLHGKCTVSRVCKKLRDCAERPEFWPLKPEYEDALRSIQLSHRQKYAQARMLQKPHKFRSIRSDLVEKRGNAYYVQEQKLAVTRNPLGLFHRVKGGSVFMRDEEPYAVRTRNDNRYAFQSLGSETNAKTLGATQHSVTLLCHNPREYSSVSHWDLDGFIFEGLQDLSETEADGILKWAVWKFNKWTSCMVKEGRPFRAIVIDGFDYTNKATLTVHAVKEILTVMSIGQRMPTFYNVRQIQHTIAFIQNNDLHEQCKDKLAALEKRLVELWKIEAQHNILL